MGVSMIIKVNRRQKEVMGLCRRSKNCPPESHKKMPNETKTKGMKISGYSHQRYPIGTGFIRFSTISCTCRPTMNGSSR